MRHWGSWVNSPNTVICHKISSAILNNLFWPAKLYLNHERKFKTLVINIVIINAPSDILASSACTMETNFGLIQIGQEHYVLLPWDVMGCKHDHRCNFRLMSKCKRDVTPLLTHRSHVFLALKHQNVLVPSCARPSAGTVTTKLLITFQCLLAIIYFGCTFSDQTTSFKKVDEISQNVVTLQVLTTSCCQVTQ